MENSFVIIIPVYQQSFTQNEKKSIANTISVFGSNKCCFIAPESWNDKLLNDFEISPGYRIQRFSNFYFRSVEGYNQLLLTKQFYNTFSAFSHMLICQTDAWVFQHRLEEWMQKPYDYFGAPLITSVNNNQLEFVHYGGNGGFSLRRIGPCIKVLSRYKIMRSPKALIAYYKEFHKGFSLYLRIPLIVAGFFGYRNNSANYIKSLRSNEDVFWSQKAMLIDPRFRPAPVEQEIAFAFERYPSQLFEMNQRKLPFGCHAWEKYEPSFWKNYIDVKA